MTMSQSLTVLIQSLAIFSCLLLLGTFLRAKVRFFQKYFIPSCVIGGFIGLILGPNVLGLLPISDAVMSTASALPGILIVLILASTPMCTSSFGGSGKQKDVLVLALIVCFMPFVQFALGLLVNVICTGFGIETFKTLGLDMAMGFMGGHGMAASLGSSLQAAGDMNWEVAQGMAVTTATIGMIGGIIIGTFLINAAARKGQATCIKEGKGLSREWQVGLYAKDAQRPSMGPQTTVSNSIETLSLHFGLILMASGGGYMLMKLISLLHNSMLSAMATWFYAMVVMFILWTLIRKLKLDYLFDETVKNKLTGFLSDYLIVAAILSIPVKIVASYWLPLVFECVLGLIATPILNWYLCKRLLRNNWFESSLGTLGSNTGVFVTGMLLIKMADPDLKTSALNNYSLGYTLASFVIMPIISFVIMFTYTKGALLCMLLNIVMAIITLGIMMGVGHKQRS